MRTSRSIIYALRITVLVGLLMTAALTARSSSVADTSNQAGLVVQFGDGSVRKFCVDMTTNEMNGLELLNNVPALDVIADETSFGFGAGICKINNDGCDFPAEDCFCQCQGLSCSYWSYWHLTQNNAWEYSQVGAANYTLHAGQVDGWRWGVGETNNAPPPPVYTLDQICSEAATATPTPTPTTSPRTRLLSHPPAQQRPAFKLLSTRRQPRWQPGNAARSAGK